MQIEAMTALDQTARGIRRQQAFELAKAAMAALIAREPSGTQVDVNQLTDDAVRIAQMQLDKLRKANIV